MNFIFFKATSLHNIKKYVVTEEELTGKEKDLLLGEIINMWNKSPKTNKVKFFHHITRGIF